MKKYNSLKIIYTVLAVIFVCCVQMAHGQSIKLEPVVQATSGGYSKSGNLSLTFTIGQPAQATRGNGFKITEGFQQPQLDIIQVNLDSISIHTTFMSCLRDTLTMSVINVSGQTQQFAIKIHMAYTSMADSFLLIPQTFFRDTVVGNDVYLIADSFPARDTVMLSYAILADCNAIPVSGVNGDLLFVYSVTDNDTLTMAAQSFNINGSSNNADTVTPHYFYPSLGQAGGNINVPLAVGSDTTISLVFSNNSGVRDYSGPLALDSLFACYMGAVTVDTLVLDSSGVVIQTIIHPTFPDTLQVNIPHSGSIRIWLNIRLNSCLPTGSCIAFVDPHWGCNGQLCHEFSNTVSITVNQTSAPAQVVIARIAPVNINGRMWDNSCSGDETEWEFLIKNIGSLTADNVDIRLNQYDTSAFTLIPSSSIVVSDSDSRFPNSIRVVDSVYFSLLDTSHLLNDGPLSYFRELRDSGNPALKSLQIIIPSMPPGQNLVLRFKTLRCCARENVYNTGVNYNRWTFDDSHYYSCGGHQFTYANLQPNFFPHGFDSVTTYNPSVYQNRIGAEVADGINEPDLKLNQTVTSDLANITGGRGGCGTPELMTIKNFDFPSIWATEYDAQLFCDTFVTIGTTVVGLHPHGQFKVIYKTQPGLQMASTPPFIVHGSVTWNALSWSVFSADSAVAIFDIDSGFNIPVNDTFTTFKAFFTNSSLSYWIMGCCGGGIDSFYHHPTATVSTLFNPQPHGNCNDCFIPLSQVSFGLELHCPGCITPGVNITYYKLQRQHYGYEDANDNGLCDSITPVSITSGYAPLENGLMALSHSIPGDTLQSIAFGYLTDGDPSSGFTYLQWQNYWDSINDPADTLAPPMLRHLYFEQHFSDTLDLLGLRCIEAYLLYYSIDSAGPTTYAFGVSPSSPIYIDSGRLIFHVPVDSMGIIVQPGDSFRVYTRYLGCNNPDDEIALNVDAEMYYSLNYLSGYPYRSISVLGDVYEHADTNLPRPARYNPSTDAVFMCEANALVHTVHPVVREYKETWIDESLCGKKADVTAGYYIKSISGNAFPYEYRPIPFVNLPGATTFHFGIPDGYSAHPLSTWARIRYRNTNSQLITTNSWTDTSGILPRGSWYGAGGFDFSIDTTETAYMYGADPIVNAGVLISSPANLTAFSNNGEKVLLLSDEMFSQTMHFEVSTICSNRNLGEAAIDTLADSLAYAILPDFSQPCSDSLTLTVLDSSSIQTYTTNSPLLHVTLGSCVLQNGIFTQPFFIAQSQAKNLRFYIKKSEIPLGLELLCASRFFNCGSVFTYRDTIINGTDTFYAYTDNTLLDLGNPRGGYFSFQAKECSRLGDTLYMPLYYMNSCDSFNGILPPIGNLCDIPDTLLIPFVYPDVDAGLNSSMQAGPYSACEPIKYSVEIYNNLAGGLGDFDITLTIPVGAVLDSQYIHYNNTIVVVPDSVVHVSPSDSIWRIYLHSGTSFDNTDSTRLNGLNNTEKLTIDFWLRGNCHTDTIGKVKVKVNSVLYCGTDLDVAIDSNWTSSSSPLQTTFDGISVSSTGCGPIVGIEPLGGPCGDSLMFSVSGYGPFDTVWTPYAPDFNHPDTGTYYVSVTDVGGCEARDTVNVAPNFTVAIKLLDAPCDTFPGLTFVLDTLPPGSYSYLWSTGSLTDTINGETDELYTVVVTNAAGCSDSASKEVLSLSPSQHGLCIDVVDTITFYGTSSEGDLLSGGTPPFVFAWTLADDTSMHYAITMSATDDPYIFTYTIPDSLLDIRLSLFTTDSNNCKVVSPVQKYRYKCCFFGPNDSILNFLSDTVIISATNIYQQQIYIDSGVVITISDTLLLSECEVVLGIDAAIVVEDSALFIVQGSRLHGCKKMWQGITVEDGATIKTENSGGTLAIIEDAMAAISIAGAEAKMFLTNTQFKRNMYGIQANYFGFDSTKYNISGCYFGMGDYTRMLPVPEGYAAINKPLAGIEAKFSKLSIPNAYYSGIANTFENMNNGIRSYWSELNIFENYFSHMRNTESGLNINGCAVYAAGNGTWTPRSLVKVLPADTAAGAGSAPHIKDCTFGIYASVTKLLADNIRMDSVTHGIKAKGGNDKIWIRNNYISHANFGITLIENAAEQQIGYNTILVDNPEILHFPLLPYGWDSAEVLNNTFGIYAARVNNNIPVSLNIYNNHIENGLNCIYLNNLSSAQVVSNVFSQSTNPRISTAQSGLYASNCQGLVVEDNAVTGNSTLYSFGANQSAKSGYSFYRSTGEVCSNSADSVGYGAYFASDCYGLKVRTNAYGPSKYAIYLQSSGSSEVLGDQGYDSISYAINHAERHQNEFEGSGSGHSFDNSDNYRTFSRINISIDSFYIRPIFFYTGAQNTSNVQYPDTSGAILNGVAKNAVAIQPILITSTNITPHNCPSLTDPSVEPWEFLIAGGQSESYMESGYSEIGDWLASRKLFTKLSLDTALLSIDTVFRNFYNSYAAMPIGEIFTYEAVLALLSDSSLLADSIAYKAARDSAAERNKDIIHSNTPESNFVLVNNIYLSYLQNQADTLNTTQINTLAGIAEQCPYIAGDAVYMARAMLAQVGTLPFFDDVALCTISGKRGMDEQNTVEQAAKEVKKEFVKVYPNPASNKLNVLFQANTNGQVNFELSTTVGQPVKNIMVHQGDNYITFGVNDLAGGMYIWRLKDERRVVASGKIVIQR